MSERKISEAMKIKIFILILIVGIIFMSSNLMPLVNAQPIPTSLTITVPSGPQWNTCTMETTLKDENGNPLQNMDIDFVYAHEDHTHLLGTTKTDSNGVASLTYTFGYAIAWKINAKFSGTISYASASSEYIDIIIIDYTPYFVGGGGSIAVAIIGVVGYLVLRRRKKAITMPMTTKEEKKMRINPLQIGFSIIMGLVIVWVSYFLQSIVNPYGNEWFWILILFGESLIVLGFIEKERMISSKRAKILLQIGVVLTIIWVMLFILGRMSL